MGEDSQSQSLLQTCGKVQHGRDQTEMDHVGEMGDREGRRGTGAVTWRLRKVVEMTGLYREGQPLG